MKQTLQPETSYPCDVFTAGLISSTKGDIQRAQFISMNDKHFLTFQSMKHHDNDLDPGPSAANGFSRKRCFQSVLTDNSRTPVKSAAKGHPWVPSQAGYNFKALDNAMDENLSSERCHAKQKTSAGNPGMMNLCLETKLTGSTQQIVATKFQLYLKGQLTHPIRAVLFQLPVDVVKTKPGNGLVSLHSIRIIKMYCRRVSHFFQKIYLGLLRIGQFPGEIYFRLGRITGLKQLLKLITRQVYFAKTSMNIIQQIDLQLIQN